MIYSYRFRYIGKDGKVKYGKKVASARDATSAKKAIKAKYPSAYRFIQLGQW